MGKHFTSGGKAEIERLHNEELTHREIGEQLEYERIQTKEHFHRLYRKQRNVTNTASVKEEGPGEKDAADITTRI